MDFILHSNGTKVKRGLSWPGIRSYGAGFHRHSLVQRDSLTCGLGTRHHLQINVLESQKGATQQKGHAATQRSKCPSADAAHNALASVTLFQTRSFGFGSSLSPSNKCSLWSSCFPWVHLRRLLQSGGSGWATWNRDGTIFSLKEQTDASSTWRLTILTCNKSGNKTLLIFQVKMKVNCQNSCVCHLRDCVRWSFTPLAAGGCVD